MGSFLGIPPRSYELVTQGRDMVNYLLEGKQTPFRRAVGSSLRKRREVLAV